MWNAGLDEAQTGIKIAGRNTNNHCRWWRKAMTNLDSILKRWEIANKSPSSQAMVFPVVMCGCDSWIIKKMSTEELMLLNCGIGEESWESLACNKIKPVSPKGNQFWIFIGKTDADLIWRTDFLEKTLMLGKIEGRRRRGRQRMRELNGITDSSEHEFEQALGVGDGQESLVCCSPWGHKESDTTEQLNWTLLWKFYKYEC